MSATKSFIEESARTVRFNNSHKRSTTSDGVIVWPQHQQVILYGDRALTTDDRGSYTRSGTLVGTVCSPDHDERRLDDGASETAPQLRRRFVHTAPTASIQIGMPRPAARVAVVDKRTDRYLTQIL
jgi:hypothetical protein